MKRHALAEITAMAYLCKYEIYLSDARKMAPIRLKRCNSYGLQS